MFTKTALIISGLLVGLFIAEAGLRIFEKIENRQIANEYKSLLQPIPDPKLGLRLAPYAPGHDGKGFRNIAVPGQADIVAIGDSQTWGINASRMETWPQRLAGLLGRNVYNMSLGYYGPVQYWVLIEEALALSPKVIVIGLYFGNDIWGAYQTVYRDGIHTEFRNKKAPNDLLLDTISLRVQHLADEEIEFQTQFQKSRPPSWSTWLYEHSAIIRLLDRRGLFVGNTMNDKYEGDKAWALAYPEHGSVYENGRIRTVLTPAYRLVALDLDEPQIAEGLRITKEILLRIQARTKELGIGFVVLLIPTKEMVCAEALTAHEGHLEDTYGRLVQMETRVHDEITSLCEENGIKYVDMLPIFMKAIRDNKQIYPSNSDGHPNPYGYFLIASAIKKTLKRLKW